MRRFTHKAMDTEFSVSFGLNEDARLCESAANACFERIDALELLLSRFHDTSDVAVIRGLRPGEVATVARETMDVLLASAQVCGATGGAFDPTVAPVMDRLREPGANWASLTEEVRDDALARGGMQRLVLDVDNLRVAVKEDRRGRPTPLELDFGGIGKGYALDACGEVLRSEQFELSDWLLDAGSSTQLISGGPWPLGVGGGWKGRTRTETVLRLSDGALSGSGFEIQGQHVVDVRRRGAAASWAQTWSRAKSAAVADALSTAALALSRRELEAACRALDARVLVAREQRPFFDRLRDPLAWFGTST